MAVSLTENINYRERLDIQGRSFDCYILIWDYKDFHRFSPIAVLESPLEITSFEFKPDENDFLIAGAING